VPTPSGNGSSIDAINAIDGTCCVSDVIGLFRQAAAPGYQSNCFLLNRDSRTAGRILITLSQGNGAPIAVQIVELQPGGIVRLLDVFSALGTAPGDHDNIRARFELSTPFLAGSPVVFKAACTVQDNGSTPISESPSSMADVATDGRPASACIHAAVIWIAAIRCRHSRGPVLCTDSPFASTATVTGMFETSNS
jgi:hypothetical protein